MGSQLSREGDSEEEHKDLHQQELQQQQQRQQDQQGIWMGIDLGTSNCACAVWDSNRARPKWIRLNNLAVPQSNGKAGRIVPSAVHITRQLSSSVEQDNNNNSSGVEAIFLSEQGDISSGKNLLWKDIVKWNPQWIESAAINSQSKATSHAFQARVGYKVLEQLQENFMTPKDKNMEQQQQQQQHARVITSMKRVLGVCDTTNLNDLDPVFRKSLPFALEETKDGHWVVPCPMPIISSNTDETATISESDGSAVLYLRPIHVAAIILKAIRADASAYLSRAIPKKKMCVPGYHQDANISMNDKPCTNRINNVVIGVPAYFGQSQRKAVEEAARLAGFPGHVSTLTESTAAAMAYGLFVGGGGTSGSGPDGGKVILVLDMGGGTTDITIAEMKSSLNDDNKEDFNATESPHQQFEVIVTDGDNRLGGEDMDQALYNLVLQKAAVDATSTSSTEKQQQHLTAQQRQSLLRSCQQAKENLCGDIDHGDAPEESTTVQIRGKSAITRMELTERDLNHAIQPLLDRTAQLLARTLHRYAEKAKGKLEGDIDGSQNLIQEVILIGGATRVPALRQMLQEKFFPHLELCTSVNAMSAVAEGAAIQAAILSHEVPLYELRSAMMLDTTPHAIGVLLPGDDHDQNHDNDDDKAQRFVEILPRDTPLPAKGYATFYVADLDQKGVTVAAVESIAVPQTANDGSKKRILYQQLGDFSFLLHRLSESQRADISNDKDHPGLRPVDIGMTLGTDGAFQVSTFDSNDPDHLRKKEFYQKAKQHDGNDPEQEASLLLDFVVKTTTTDWKSEGITTEEWKLILTASMLLVFYFFVKLLLPKHEILPEEDLARIL